MRFQTPKDKEIWERRRRESRGAGRDRPPPRSNPPTRDAIDAFRRSMAGDGGAGPKRASRSHAPSERPPAPSERPPVKAPLQRATLKAPKEPGIILADPADDGGRLRAFLRHGVIFAGLAIVIALQGGLLIAALRDDAPKLDPAVAAALRDGGAGPASDFDVARGGGGAGPLFQIDPVHPEIAPPTPAAESDTAPAPELDAGHLADVVEPAPAPEPAQATPLERGPAPPDRLAEKAPKPDAAPGGGLQIAPELDIAEPEVAPEMPQEPELAASLPEPAAGPATVPPDAAPARPLPSEVAGGPRPDAAPPDGADAVPSTPQPDTELDEVAGRALLQLLGEAGAVVRKAPSPQPAAGPIKLVTFTPDVMPTHDGAPEPDTGPAPAEMQGVAAADDRQPRSSGRLADTAGLALAQLVGEAAPDSPGVAGPRSGSVRREPGVALATEPAPAASGPRIFVHYTASTPGAGDHARRLAGYLQARGLRVADVRGVDFRIRESSVRYFFDADRQDAQTLGAGLRDFLANVPEEAPVEVEDFTHYRPKPARGNLEVWLPSS